MQEIDRKTRKRKRTWAWLQKREKQIVIGMLTAALLLTSLNGCNGRTARKLYTAQFLSLFDTVTQIQGYAEDEASFKELAQQIRGELETYHQLYDAYETYEGLVNIKTLNDQAGETFSQIDERLWDLLVFGKELYVMTKGQVNMGMGSVLQIWHAYREQGTSDPSKAKVPSFAELQEAAQHTDLETVLLNEADRSVVFEDEKLQLDVGAMAKGYALEQVCKKLEEQGVNHLLISVGGNIRAIGPKADGSPWRVRIPDPKDPQGDPLVMVELASGSLVSSGVYQRYYTVEGKRYHHIIDPESLYPTDRYLAVTVQIEDSGMADGLSTALFNLDQEAGEALLKETGALVGWWVYPDGSTCVFRQNSI